MTEQEFILSDALRAIGVAGLAALSG